MARKTRKDAGKRRRDGHEHATVGTLRLPHVGRRSYMPMSARQRRQDLMWAQGQADVRPAMREAGLL